MNVLVVAAVGEDRPGIVNEICKAIADAGCNIEDSRMSVLGGDFALMLLVDGKWNELAKLETALPAVGRRLGLLINVKRTNRSRRSGDLLPYSVEVVALDHPGIVYQLANFFSAREINIREMTTT